MTFETLLKVLTQAKLWFLSHKVEEFKFQFLIHSIFNIKTQMMDFIVGLHPYFVFLQTPLPLFVPIL